jgi:hypothetical protein
MRVIELLLSVKHVAIPATGSLMIWNAAIYCARVACDTLNVSQC